MNRSGRTVLTWAVIEGQLEVLQLLLSRANVFETLKSADHSGKSPLDWAVALNHVSMQESFWSRIRYEGNLNGWGKHNWWVGCQLVVLYCISLFLYRLGGVALGLGYEIVVHIYMFLDRRSLKNT